MNRTAVSISIAFQWPIDLSRYDRTFLLTDREQEALETLVYAPSQVSTKAIEAREQLARLLTPLHDMLQVTEAAPHVYTGVRLRMLREMHRRQTAFWSWTTDEWLETIRIPKTQYPGQCFQYLLALGYLTHAVADIHAAGRIQQHSFTRKIFGQLLVDTAVNRVRDVLVQWGHKTDPQTLPNVVCDLLLMGKTPVLEELTLETFEQVRQSQSAGYVKDALSVVSRALVGLRILASPLPAPKYPGQGRYPISPHDDVPEQWAGWCRKWRETSTLAPRTRVSGYYILMKVGRWLASTHPECLDPARWTREIAAEFVAAVDRMQVGEWTVDYRCAPERLGKPLTAGAKNQYLVHVRRFFQDCQEWEWIPRHFDPRRSLATPRAIRACLLTNPRVIADDVWGKLLWAGLNLTLDDLPLPGYAAAVPREDRDPFYPLEMVRAIAVVWLFCGLRSNEVRRLRVGCIRWQRSAVPITGTVETLPKDAVCLLDIPTNKTKQAFTKPVDRVVGEAIALWEQARPPQPAAVDAKTGEVVDYLFSYRGCRLGEQYLNGTLIPVLGSKAGVPLRDARGNITSHRARSTIASMLYNAREPMTLFELQEWLGHRSPASTQFYAKITPTKLAKSYADAGYFERNRHMIEVLIDQDAIKSGAAAQGEPWRYFDLGHGYCTYDFFDQCPHRMACARCAFYLPKGSSQAQLLEAKANLQHMLQAIPLSEEERRAVEEGITAMEQLCERLADVPTPAGPTPRMLAADKKRSRPLLPMLRSPSTPD